ncbi:hypothetical protein PR048_031037 [Dryococelus australis]|uniref:Uncharacterized protein n=1 Tax=Dryococelus australis TaxID=614101 RepID=A0ABQ9G794_9NEOP|nr:hypothetical protein PR048_031037 [Dryococelus australis]
MPRSGQARAKSSTRPDTRVWLHPLSWIDSLLVRQSSKLPEDRLVSRRADTVLTRDAILLACAAGTKLPGGYSTTTSVGQPIVHLAAHAPRVCVCVWTPCGLNERRQLTADFYCRRDAIVRGRHLSNPPLHLDVRSRPIPRPAVFPNLPIVGAENLPLHAPSLLPRVAEPFPRELPLQEYFSFSLTDSLQMLFFSPAVARERINVVFDWRTRYKAAPATLLNLSLFSTAKVCRRSEVRHTGENMRVRNEEERKERGWRGEGERGGGVMMVRIREAVNNYHLSSWGRVCASLWRQRAALDYSDPSFWRGQIPAPNTSSRARLMFLFFVGEGGGGTPGRGLAEADRMLRKPWYCGLFLMKLRVNVACRKSRYPSVDGATGRSVFSHVGIMPDDGAGRRVFYVIFRYIPALLHTHLTSPSSALITSILRAAQISSTPLFLTFAWKLFRKKQKRYTFGSSVAARPLVSNGLPRSFQPVIREKGEISLQVYDRPSLLGHWRVRSAGVWRGRGGNFVANVNPLGEMAWPYTRRALCVFTSRHRDEIRRLPSFTAAASGSYGMARCEARVWGDNPLPEPSHFTTAAPERGRVV